MNEGKREHAVENEMWEWKWDGKCGEGKSEVQASLCPMGLVYLCLHVCFALDSWLEEEVCL